MRATFTLLHVAIMASVAADNSKICFIKISFDAQHSQLSGVEESFGGRARRLQARGYASPIF